MSSAAPSHPSPSATEDPPPDLPSQPPRPLQAGPGPQRCIIFIGPPGCGKGTQSERVKGAWGLGHLATGDMLRAAVAAHTAPGRRASDAMEKGELVDEDVIVEILGEAMRQPACEKGFILDGFPRSVAQAEKLDKMLEERGSRVLRVLNFRIPDSAVEDRVLFRLTDPGSGRTYNTKLAPPKVTGEPLVRRKDDNEETLRRRLSAFHRETEPVIEFYKTKGLVVDIHADRTPADVTQEVNAALE